jgi:DNA-binding response OmpR family regulator
MAARVLIVDDEPSILRILAFKLRRGRELSAAAYITKPFSLQQVLEEVARLVAP